MGVVCQSHSQAALPPGETPGTDLRGDGCKYIYLMDLAILCKITSTSLRDCYVTESYMFLSQYTVIRLSVTNVITSPKIKCEYHIYFTCVCLL